MVRLIAAIALVSGGVPASAVTRPGVDTIAVANSGLAADPVLMGLSAIDARAVPGMIAPAGGMAPLAIAAGFPAAPAQTTAEAIDDLLPDSLTLAILALGLALFGVLMRRRVPTVSA